MNLQKRTRLTVLALLALTTQIGCEQRSLVETTQSAIFQEEYDYVLAVVLDLSGSFTDKMFTDDAKAYRFFLRASDDFFRNRLGEADQLILGRISGSNEGLLWQGHPGALRQTFPNAMAFKEFLSRQADPGGSLVHENLGQTLMYLTSLPGVTDKTQLMVVVLSDLEDTAATSQDSVRQALAAYAQRRGAIGLYYVSQNLVPMWTQLLQQSGIQNYTVQSEIVEHPPVLRFD